MTEWTEEERANLVNLYPDLRWFDTAHLADRVAVLVTPFRDLAFDVAGGAASTASYSQVTLCIQRLIEAKDAAVRARVAAEQIIERNKNAEG